MIIYTDGSAIGNPGPGGWGAIIKSPSGEVVLKGGEAHSTNNRMEMTAVLEALRHVQAEKPERAEIFSDSKLVIETLTKGWKRKKNNDLWVQIDVALEKIAINETELSWNWVKGHHEDEMNLRVDMIAQKEARNRC